MNTFSSNIKVRSALLTPDPYRGVQRFDKLKVGRPFRD